MAADTIHLVKDDFKDERDPQYAYGSDAIVCRHSGFGTRNLKIVSCKACLKRAGGEDDG